MKVKTCGLTIEDFSEDEWFAKKCKYEDCCCEDCVCAMQEFIRTGELDDFLTQTF
jgi:hypothetical protein